MMAPADVLAVVNLLEASRCTVWIDGGWGVDALLGRQTRPHLDLDLAITRAGVATAQNALTQRLGYAVFQDELPTRLDLRDNADHRIDFHPLVFDDHGNGRQQLPDGSWGVYPADGLAGIGFIDGRQVRCLGPELQLQFHVGYEPDEDDRHDVALLSDTPHGLKPSGCSRPARKPYRWDRHHGYRNCLTRRRCPRRTVLATVGHTMNPVSRRVPPNKRTCR